MRRRFRLCAAFTAALCAAPIAYIKIQQNGGYPADSSYWWVAARAWLAGQDPYQAVRPGTAWFDNGLMVPLPAVLAYTPLAPFSVVVAGILFAALGIGMLCYALLGDTRQRWPILLSLPALWAVQTGQWSPFVTAAALTPGMAWAAACKPTLGVGAWVYRMQWKFLLIAGGFALFSLVLWPMWPIQWIDATRHATAGNYHVPVLTGPGAVLVLAALRWRRPDARLLLAMSLVPQSMFPYDQLALGLIAETRKQAIVFALWSYAVVWGSALVAPAWAASKSGTLHYLALTITMGYYVPLLVLVLRRPNHDAEMLTVVGRASGATP